MSQKIEEKIKSILSARSALEIEVVQSLWSGYGKISRWKLEGSKVNSLIVKVIQTHEKQNHPKGWNTSISHERKMRSYQVEMNWYEKFAAKCDANCRLPKCYALERTGEEQLLFLEDLDEVGFPLRRTSLNFDELKLCLSWLAHFHATFMMLEPKGLWETGTYWHLETRPDEFEKMESGWLKDHAKEIDSKLSQAKYKTLVHGDAKVANFCFSNKMDKVAAVDFQYVGGGCGMKDVAYLMSSCLSAQECEEHEGEILDFYFKELKFALTSRQKALDLDALEHECRELYPYAWADFVRFLKGWAPEHYKLNEYSEGMVESLQ